MTGTPDGSGGEAAAAPLARVYETAAFQWSVLLLVFGLLGWSHWPLLVEDPLLGRDDRALIEPLAAVSSISAYVDALTGRKLLDLQPVRDASFIANLWLKRTVGHGFFHATNLAIWFGVVVLLHRLLSALRIAPWVALGAASLFALHPALAMAVAWVAARKHLLSCLFILVATLLMRRALRMGASRGLTAGVVAAYALSVFAQPITLLWPLWAALAAWVEARERFRELCRIPLLCLPVLFAAAALNLRYYSVEYAEQATQKFADGAQFGVSLLALGRAFFNLLLPVRVATSYDPGSVYNLVGLALLAVFALAVFRYGDRRSELSWGAFALLPLAVVLGRMTNIFLSDPYLLTPAVGLTCLLALVSGPRIAGARRSWPGATAAALVLGLSLFALSFDVVRSWRSDAAVWARAYEVEPTPNALAKQAYYLASAGRTEEAFEVALRLKEWAPAHPEAEYVLSRAVFLDRKLSPGAQLQLIAEHALPGPWTAYFQAILHARLGRFDEAFVRIRAGLAEPRAFKDELPIIVAEATLICRRARGSSCEALAVAFRSEPSWSEGRYRARLEQK